MPRRLADLRKENPGLQAERVWCTLCCCAFLQSLNVCWLFTDGDLYPDVELTVVDQARLWIDSHAEEHPALAAALADGALVKAAKRTMMQWHRAWKRRVGELRRLEAFTDNTATSHAHRASAEMLRAVIQKHSTFSVFLSAPLDGLQRWQSAHACGGRCCLACVRASDMHFPCLLPCSVDVPGDHHHHAAAGEHLDVRAPRVASAVAHLMRIVPQFSDALPMPGFMPRA
jgi:hypothetical protein